MGRENGTDVCPVGTSTEAGTEATLALELERVTVAPLGPAAPFKLTVPVEAAPRLVQSLQEHEGLLQQYDCEVLPKPFDLDVLLAKVKAALAKYPRNG